VITQASLARPIPKRRSTKAARSPILVGMRAFEVERPPYLITTDTGRFDLDKIWGWLSGSYWAAGVPRAVVERAIQGSLSFGVFEGSAQLGLARVVTDHATFAYLADVFVDESVRGLGLGKWLVATLQRHPDLQGLRRFMLGTRDAHGLYAQLGFRPLGHPEIFMEIHDPDVYKSAR
jgi:GNAT superfamily N-acetyltransferase